MKTTRYFGFMILLLSGLFFIQCTSEPIAGPPGMDGINGVDGQDGADGIDGQDGTASCVACHSDSHREPIETSYLYSDHAAGGAVGYAGSRGSCSRCHSNEGYINYITGMPAVDIDSPTPISCKTCHDSHSTFDFENDGHDFALRGFDPVTLITDTSIVIDYGNTSNNCAECHQPRRTPPLDDGAGMFEVTSSHWGPHHSPQVTFLEGIQGALIAGSVGYPGVGSATHRTGSSCVECHMTTTANANQDGLHSMIPNDNACTTCHTNGVPTQVAGLDADLATLAALLETVGIVHDGHPVLGTYTIKEAEAAWNYLLVTEDQSNGIHNPAYARALIKNSIEALQ